MYIAAGRVARIEVERIAETDQVEINLAETDKKAEKDQVEIDLAETGKIAEKETRGSRGTETGAQENPIKKSKKTKR